MPHEYSERVRAHVRRFFARHDVRPLLFERGPIQRVVPGFHVLEVAPGPQHGLTTYVSVGTGFQPSADARPLELIIATDEPAERHVELLAMASYYHLTGEPLGAGHTFPIGEPWVPGSTLDHMLVSLPYPYGPDLERLALDGREVQLLWLLPITRSECDHKRTHGLEALEALFDDAPLEYWDARRRPVV